MEKDQLLDEKYREIQAAVVRNRPQPQSGEGHAVEIMTHIAAGEPVIVLKPISYDGRDLQPGDVFTFPTVFNARRVNVLLERGYFGSPNKYEAGRTGSTLKHYFDNEIAPRMTKLERQRGDRNRQAAVIADLEHQLQEARSLYGVYLERVSDAERELERALEGEELSLIAN